MSGFHDTDPPENATHRLGAEAKRNDNNNSPSVAQSGLVGKELEIAGSPKIRTFRHGFRGGVTCEIQIDLDRIRRRQSGIQCCEWSRKPKPRVIPEYRRWMLSVNQQVSDETGLKVMEALQTKPHLWELWFFEPGRAPRKVREVTCP